MFVGFDAMMTSNAAGNAQDSTTTAETSMPVAVEGQFEDADSDDESGTDDDDSRMSICSEYRQVASPAPTLSIHQPERADAQLLLDFVSQTSAKVSSPSHESQLRNTQTRRRRPLPPKKNWSRTFHMNASISRDTESGRLAHSNSFKPIEAIPSHDGECKDERLRKPRARKQDPAKLSDDEADSSGDESSNERQEKSGDLDKEKACVSESEIRDNDVLCGRGGGTNNHVGNRYFRLLVDRYRHTYVMAKKANKGMLAMGIVSLIRSTTLKGDSTEGGRFLKKNEKTGYWYDIGDTKAAEKTSQALREGLAKKMREVIELSTRTSNSLSQHLQLPAPPSALGQIPSENNMDTSVLSTPQTQPMFGLSIPRDTPNHSTSRRQSGSVHFIPPEPAQRAKRQRHSL